MAVLAGEPGMSSEGEIQRKDSSHEFNVYVDRQLQNKLIEAAEELVQEDYDSKLSKPGNNLKKPTKVDSKVEDITGWFTHAKFVARRTTDGAKSESKPQKDTFIHPWRDYRAKKEESFVFKHYTDTRKYIEQYRTDHSCNNARFSSGGQTGELRRVAFQNSTVPPQQSVQVTIQQMQQANCNANTSSSLLYTNRKDPSANPNPSSQTCSCGRPSHGTATDTTNLSHKYKFAPAYVPAQMTRTNTEIKCHYGDSDNSSESGDFGSRTPTRRINSAASVRSKHGMSRMPTKITVPANPNNRPYPIQALTIQQQQQQQQQLQQQQQQQQQQQNGKPDSASSSKPLDNLNCVAPEKQMMYVGRKDVEPMGGFTLNVHNISDLLTTNEAPLRGYALPKSSPPTPKRENSESPGSYYDSYIDDDDADVVSLDALSTCPLGADVHIRPRPIDPHTSEILQMFLNDPVLSKLNQRPVIKGENNNGFSPFYQPSFFGSDHICMPQNDIEGISKVNMWNPIVSTPLNSRAEPHSQNYKNMMWQVPFRKPGSETRLAKPAHVDLQQVRTYSGSRRDYFSPNTNVKLSITKLDNAVSFCQTSISTNQDSLKKLEKLSKTVKFKGGLGSDTDNSSVDKRDNFNENTNGKPHVHFSDSLGEANSKVGKGESRMCLPLPKVKIFENLPLQHTQKPSSEHSELETKVFVDIESVDDYHPDSALEQKPRSANSLSNPRGTDSGLTLPEKPKLDGILAKPNTNSKDEVKKDSEKGLDVSVVKGVRMNVEKRNEKAETSKQMANKGREATRQRVSKKAVKKPSVASGKLLKSQQELEGLTWSEKLEVLRSVNKPPEKPRRKKPKLKFVKDEPEGVWNSEQEQLYEQRRIKHLVEQARIKGGKQFDWVYEAQMRSKGIDWDRDKGRVDNSASSGGETSESDTEEGPGQENRGRLGKYGIYVPPKGSKHKLFNPQPVTRSNTFVSH